MCYKCDKERERERERQKEKNNKMHVVSTPVRLTLPTWSLLYKKFLFQIP